MKNLYLFLFCLCILPASAQIASSTIKPAPTPTAQDILNPPKSKGAVLELKEQNIIIEALSKGETKKGTLDITNNGLDVLEISNMSTTCKCLKITLPSTKIKSGETVQLNYLFTPKRSGNFKETIYLGSNSKRKVSIINVRAVVN